MGIEDKVPKIFLTETSGIYSEWHANAIGRNSKGVREFLESKYPFPPKGEDVQLSREEAVKLAVQSVLEVVHSDANYIEVAVMNLDSNVNFLSTDEVKTLITLIEKEKAEEAEKKMKP
jgi:20S proteasome subunit alpha 4